jgi:hypothetical protein
MKKIKIKLIPACFIFGLCIVIMNGCKKNDSTTTTTSIPFQGPQNPSFETPNANWVGGAGTNGYFVYSTGTGFLPSQGVYYATIRNGFSNALNFYQDGVDFSHSTSMTFDYTLSFNPDGYTLPPSASVVAQILFTENGTVTLWQDSVTATTTPHQFKNIKFNLPSLPTAGRLTFQVSAALVSPGPEGTFCVDNIRVN